jgi:adenosylcobinamide-GDP ribazoletransferase
MISRELRLLRIALQFLTRVPAGPIADWPPDWLARSAKYMPLVGALIGAIAGGVVMASAIVFPDPLPIVLGLATAMVITGALHEDGLADTADAFGGGRTREHSLEIMKDSRIGTYGTLALIVVLALKAAALLPLGYSVAARVLIAGHAAARLASVLALSKLKYASPGNSKVGEKTSALTSAETAVAVALGLTPAFLLLDLTTAIISLAFAFIAAAALTLIAQRRIGGYTGDVLGAIEQVYEATFFIFAAGVISGPG